MVGEIYHLIMVEEVLQLRMVGEIFQLRMVGEIFSSQNGGGNFSITNLFCFFCFLLTPVQIGSHCLWYSSIILFQSCSSCIVSQTMRLKEFVFLGQGAIVFNMVPTIPSVYINVALIVPYTMVIQLSNSLKENRFGKVGHNLQRGTNRTQSLTHYCVSYKRILSEDISRAT